MNSTFDPSALRELFELEADSPGLVQTLVDEFVDVSVKLVQDIEAASAANDFPKVELEAHSLKSSAKVLGLNDLAEKALELETSGRERRANASAVAELAALRAAGLTQIQSYMKSRA